MREEFEATLVDSGHGSMGGVDWCIVVVKQHSLCQLSATLFLDSGVKKGEVRSTSCKKQFFA